MAERSRRAQLDRAGRRRRQRGWLVRLSATDDRHHGEGERCEDEKRAIRRRRGEGPGCSSNPAGRSRCGEVHPRVAEEQRRPDETGKPSRTRPPPLSAPLSVCAGRPRRHCRQRQYDQPIHRAESRGTPSKRRDELSCPRVVHEQGDPV